MNRQDPPPDTKDDALMLGAVLLVAFVVVVLGVLVAMVWAGVRTGLGLA